MLQRVLSNCVITRGFRGGWGTGDQDPPLGNHKNIVFFGKTGGDPLKNGKATKTAFNVGPFFGMPVKPCSQPLLLTETLCAVPYIYESASEITGVLVNLLNKFGKRDKI